MSYIIYMYTSFKKKFNTRSLSKDKTSLTLSKIQHFLLQQASNLCFS